MDLQGRFAMKSFQVAYQLTLIGADGQLPCLRLGNQIASAQVSHFDMSAADEFQSASLPS
jgi:hypothetical protein